VALEEIINKVHVMEFRSGYDLMNLLDHQEPDLLPKLILMDMNMPSMSGLEALALVRSRSETKHIPIIIVSTSSNQQLINIAYQQGINAYLTKPNSYSDYNLIAEAISVCFLNNGPSLGEIENVGRSFRNESILVIEDNPDHWEIMQFTLNQCMPATNMLHLNDTESTLNFLEVGWLKLAAPLKLIILDLYLPTRRHGLDLLDQIRQFLTDHYLFKVLVIIFSGSDHQDDINNCYQHQANIYIVKPIDLSETIAYFHNLSLFVWNGDKVSGKTRQ
jgi:CheY-like chemotaxis protein